MYLVRVGLLVVAVVTANSAALAQDSSMSACSPSTPLAKTNVWLRNHLRSHSSALDPAAAHIATPFAAEEQPPSGTTLGDEYQAFFWPFYGSMINDVEGIGILGHWQAAEHSEAYLLRVPGTYSEASQVWLYQADRCLWQVGPFASLAEVDGGSAFRVDSWLADWNDDGHPDLVQRRKTWELDASPAGEVRLAEDVVLVYFWNPQLGYYAQTFVPDPDAIKARFDFEAPTF